MQKEGRAGANWLRWRPRPLVAGGHVTRRWGLPARGTLVAKMAAELVEAKVSERRRRRPGRAAEGARARRRSEVCDFRMGLHGADRLRLGAQPPRSPPGPGAPVAGGGRGGRRRGAGPPNLTLVFARGIGPGLEAGFSPLLPERLGSTSL